MSDVLPFMAGIAAGIASGLLPGLHSNTVISVLASLGLDDRTLSFMIIGLFPANLVFSFLPAIFFGVPDSAVVLSVLPGQRLVLRGEGMSALKTAIVSCVLAALLSAALFPATLDIYPAIYSAARPFMRYMLLAASAIFLWKSKKPLASAGIFLLAGVLGHFSLNSGLPDPFLPLFSGMFALAAMANYRSGAIPEQKDGKPGDSLLLPVAVGVLLGMAADLLPGIGSPSQVATFATMLMPLGTHAYLATISSISVSQALFSLSTAASIGKSRVGATAWLSECMDIEEGLGIIVPLFILSLALASLAVYAIRRHAARLASLDFTAMNAVLGAYIVIMTLMIDGAGGLLVLLPSCILGVLALRLGVERTNLMGAMIVPTILLLFGVGV